MFKEDTHPNLKRWCDKHYELTNIRVLPQTVPVQTLLDQMLGRIELLEAALAMFGAKANSTASQVEQVEDRVQTAEKKIDQKRRVVVKKEVKK